MENDDGVCYFGKCKRVGDGGVKRGERGTHCNNISQCAENHCCRYMQSFSTNVCDRESQEGEQCLFDPDDMGSDPDNYGGAIEIIAGSSAIKMSGGCAPCQRKLTCHHQSKTCVPRDATLD
ncbi:uncharacterized protein LOC142340839 [Convolutriloba macropyga]|uniref:uncharacterized protein LOC142340839 n=1 Tax=Convolutriloba macropyga TaxID=536237 RepID=UPI003F522FC0